MRCFELSWGLNMIVSPALALGLVPGAPIGVRSDNPRRAFAADILGVDYAVVDD
jgi:hypothetical protein